MRVLNYGFKSSNESFGYDCGVSGCNHDNHMLVEQKLDKLPIPDNYVSAQDARKKFKTKMWIEPSIKIPESDSQKRTKDKRKHSKNKKPRSRSDSSSSSSSTTDSSSSDNNSSGENNNDNEFRKTNKLKNNPTPWLISIDVPLPVHQMFIKTSVQTTSNQPQKFQHYDSDVQKFQSYTDSIVTDNISYDTNGPLPAHIVPSAQSVPIVNTTVATNATNINSNNHASVNTFRENETKLVNIEPENYAIVGIPPPLPLPSIPPSG